PNRTPLHLRDVTFRSFARPDKLFDIEGTLHDTKAYGYVMHGVERRPGEPIHDMRVRLTIDDTFTVRAVEADMPTTPFDTCQPATAPLQSLIGVKIGAGWRNALAERMGKERGCTHLRELLAGMGTAAFQTVGSYRMHLRRQAGLPGPEADNKCHKKRKRFLHHCHHPYD
ncbi:MAG: DUF2889 domain-containing protein, partial [Novosphingobium sp.]|nr:DUF2889 domain-containing protein [Novosphingobium sp.]